MDEWSGHEFVNRTSDVGGATGRHVPNARAVEVGSGSISPSVHVHW